MNPNVIIKAEDVSKAFRIGVKHQENESLLELLLSTFLYPIKNWKRLRSLDTSGQQVPTPVDSMSVARNEEDLYWALRNVSFEIFQGDIVGIIGHNGAGKSTLLKILSRITPPTNGEILIRGRVASLLEVGTGFHPELSGRDNVYLNGSILGMTKAEIESKFQAIIDFSGIEQFIDTQVKKYSSGMRVKLAFSVAAFLDPEILIIDEVLAVGDLGFQRKCAERIREIVATGRTVLFVSHNVGLIRSLCSRAIVLEGGRVVFDGDVKDGLSVYSKLISTSNESVIVIDEHFPRPHGKKSLVKEITLVDSRGVVSNMWFCGESGSIKIKASTSIDGLPPDVMVSIEDQDGVLITVVATFLSDFQRDDFSKSAVFSFECRVPEINLAPGDYYFSVGVGHPSSFARDDYLSRVGKITVVAAPFYGTGKMPESWRGVLLTRSEWKARECQGSELQ